MTMDEPRVDRLGQSFIPLGDQELAAPRIAQALLTPSGSKISGHLRRKVRAELTGDILTRRNNVKL